MSLDSDPLPRSGAHWTPSSSRDWPVRIGTVGRGAGTHGSKGIAPIRFVAARADDRIREERTVLLRFFARTF